MVGLRRKMMKFPRFAFACRAEHSAPSAIALLFLSCACLFSGCATPAQTAGLIAGGIVAATVTGAVAPGNEIDQIYYLGVFDPQEQMPLQVYRLTVHGQASAISGVKFGSGWVPAPVIDSLTGHLEYDMNPGAGIKITRDEAMTSNLQTGRRLIQFGPEGFREAPKDHRLVVVMGHSPKAFFEAVDKTLGSLSTSSQFQTSLELERDLLRTSAALTEEKAKWDRLKAQHKELFAYEKK
jgi:hypothetical protein